MVSKVLLFEGAPGAGKSTLSEFAAEQLRLNNIEAQWLEEHVLENQHFGNFTNRLKGNLPEASQALLNDWDRLIHQFSTSNGVVLLDGAYFGNTLKFLLANGMPSHELHLLAAKVDQRLVPFHPVIVNLTGNTELMMERAIEQRGNNWAHFIAQDVEAYLYQTQRRRHGITGMTQFFVDSYQEFTRLLQQTTLSQATINTELGEWQAAEAMLLDVLRISRCAAAPKTPVATDRYVGTYAPPDYFPEPFNTPFAVENVAGELRLHMVFHHNYQLVQVSDTRFRLKTKPWVLEFLLDQNGQAESAIYPFLDNSRHVCARVCTKPVRPEIGGACKCM